ncbi:hypothetical protein CALVIDRAFT_371103 [Calocera viscosa TUFC12733]|uniref:Uncharacterized protein n=1 Tax=Calocera viscosa (strain TUFC12733) TaxID=1330018 RepID=A0A167GVS2_CALVF|nr:hypothetical protein CALVIDRAFT_371103 [Calocera viscosa TUFC12733]
MRWRRTTASKLGVLADRSPHMRTSARRRLVGARQAVRRLGLVFHRHLWATIRPQRAASGLLWPRTVPVRQKAVPRQLRRLELARLRHQWVSKCLHFHVEIDHISKGSTTNQSSTVWTPCSFGSPGGSPPPAGMVALAYKEYGSPAGSYVGSNQPPGRQWGSPSPSTPGSLFTSTSTESSDRLCRHQPLICRQSPASHMIVVLSNAYSSTKSGSALCVTWRTTSRRPSNWPTGEPRRRSRSCSLWIPMS